MPVLPSEGLDLIMSDSTKIVNQEAFGLKADLIAATPVGNPDIWKTKYPPQNYVGGTMKASWQMFPKLGNVMGWTIFNPMEYASIIAAGRRVVNGREYGSNQLKDGFDPIIERTNIAITRRLQRIKR